MGINDSALRASVTHETATDVEVAMTYNQHDCKCTTTLVGIIGSENVRLKSPLGHRTVRDQFTGRRIALRHLP